MSEQPKGLAVSWANFVVRFRWAVLVVMVAAVFGVASGAQHLTFTSDYRAFFGKENPQLQSF